MGKPAARHRNRKQQSFGVPLTLAKCQPCNHSFSLLITVQPTGLQCCNPEGSSCLTWRRSWRCKDESVIRWGLSRMAWYQKLSDELIVPNLEQDVSFFYDPATKKLRKRFEIYPDALDANVQFANELERTHTELLTRIQAERSVIINTPRHHVILSKAKNLRSFLDRSLRSKLEMFESLASLLRISLQRFAQHDNRRLKDEV